ncbi:MAG TPA: hypothetical protein PLA20_04350 [Bacilli bacterium]|jgi:hypothetical protein|nr:hypothetical protein [Acholeplasmataceae bacterium]OQB60662.1 MAG: hypothetical protein BWX94_01479 [Tenericutes bacterium ADurb.Bin140]HOE78007.1 hypothetical protein [Bacilli bacterium]HON64651.1 hypothetical protein [Bacilli bacterium]HOR96079.1 hypothetical protein [Bacilli bacterium]
MENQSKEKPLYFDASATPGGIKITKRKTTIIEETLTVSRNINLNLRDSSFFDNEYTKKILRQAQSL